MLTKPVEFKNVPLELQDVYLTPREIDIVRLLAAGNSTKQVAQELNLSVNTVFGTLRRANNRLESNKYDLVYKAHLMGIVK